MSVLIKAGLKKSQWLQQELKLRELTEGRKRKFCQEIFKTEKNELRLDSISNVT